MVVWTSSSLTQQWVHQHHLSGLNLIQHCHNMRTLILTAIILLSATTCSANFMNDGLVGYYTLDRRDLVGSTIIDRGSGNNSATFSGTAGAFRTGKMFQGARLDHVDDYVNIASFNALNGTSAMTICSWNYLFSVGTTGDIEDSNIFARNVITSSDSMILFWFNVNGAGSGDRTYSFNVGNTSTAGNRVNGLVRARANRWDFVCGQMSGATRALYVNGVLDQSHALGALTSYPSGSAGATIGAAPLVSANMLYNGIIDDVRIYNRALTPVEIYNLYRYGLAKHN